MSAELNTEIVDAIEVLLETKWHEEKCGCEGGIEHCASAAYGPTAPPSTWTVQAVVDAAGGINPAFDSRHIEDAPCSSCLSCRHLDLMTRLAGLAADLSAYNPGHGDFARAGKRLHDALIPPDRSDQ